MKIKSKLPLRYSAKIFSVITSIERIWPWTRGLWYKERCRRLVLLGEQMSEIGIPLQKCWGMGINTCQPVRIPIMIKDSPSKIVEIISEMRFLLLMPLSTCTASKSRKLIGSVKFKAIHPILLWYRQLLLDPSRMDIDQLIPYREDRWTRSRQVQRYLDGRCKKRESCR